MGTPRQPRETRHPSRERGIMASKGQGDKGTRGIKKTRKTRKTRSTGASHHMHVSGRVSHVSRSTHVCTYVCMLLGCPQQQQQDAREWAVVCDPLPCWPILSFPLPFFIIILVSLYLFLSPRYVPRSCCPIIHPLPNLSPSLSLSLSFSSPSLPTNQRHSIWFAG